ncbi:hypothetical protein DN069_20445 [Streptacidiphilus pinicola]|uniref:NlpC/P60 domain-containing protein n=1 Tax=Streptacidiphilus pinicola TaxID=2219663 RepID=A0A2X0IKB9_9ACTN|nr:NlpC/P60 family protein [Streptacidiphilus pinicola]RAG83811.1 hypothetical protein DN069_20445 [Streptacidiphilus pinicola]
MSEGRASRSSSCGRLRLLPAWHPDGWGAETRRAFDCSGLTQAAYAAAGIQLPRTAQQQYDSGPKPPRGAAIEPGRLIFSGSDSPASSTSASSRRPPR